MILTHTQLQVVLLIADVILTHIRLMAQMHVLFVRAMAFVHAIQ